MYPKFIALPIKINRILQRIINAMFDYKFSFKAIFNNNYSQSSFYFQTIIKACFFLLFTILSLYLFTPLSYSIPEEEELQDQIYEKLIEEDYEAAENLYLELGEHYPSSQNFFQIARFFASQRKYEQAIDYWYRSVDDLPEEYIIIERELLSHRLYEEVLDLYFRVLEDLGREDINLNLKIINIYRLLSRYQDLTEYLISLLKMKSQYFDTYARQFIAVASREEAYSIVVESLEELVASNTFVDNRQMTLLRTLAEIYWNKGEADKAREYYIQVIQSGNIASYQLDNLLLTLVDREDYENAVMFSEAYIDYLINNTNNQYLVQQYQLKLLRYAVALNNYDKALEIVDHLMDNSEGLSFDELNYYKGKILFLKENYNEALTYLERVQRTFLQQSNVMIAQCYLFMGDYEKAAALFQDLPQDIEASYYLAITYLLQGNIPGCLSFLENTVLSFGDDPLAVKSLELYRILLNLSDKEEQLQLFRLYIQTRLVEGNTSALQFIEANLNQENQGLMLSYFYLEKVDILLEAQRYQDAADYLSTLIESQVLSSFLQEKAQFMLGGLYFVHLDKKEEGRQMLLSLIREHPNSIYLFQVRQLLSA